MTRKDHVFRRGQDGSLAFVGDFEGLYRDIEDPWAQSVADDRMGAYYLAARERLISIIQAEQEPGSVIELGCGLGQVCAMVNDAGVARRVVGLDISETAIEKARERYPHLEFHAADARRGWPSAVGGDFNVGLMNQMLWYVLDDLSDVLTRLVEAVRPGGRVIVAQAFFRGTQEYGTNVVDGFLGLVRFVAKHPPAGAYLVHADLMENPELSFDDGIVVLRRPL